MEKTVLTSYSDHEITKNPSMSFKESDDNYKDLWIRILCFAVGEEEQKSHQLWSGERTLLEGKMQVCSSGWSVQRPRSCV
jgi:hypothetical protein